MPTAAIGATCPIHVSEDGGKTWKYRRAIESGASGYSDLAAGKDGWIYCLYERDGSLVLAKFNSQWMTAPRK